MIFYIYLADERLVYMEYSDSDIIREYGRSINAESVAKKLGISVREVNRTLKRVGVEKKELHRYEFYEREHDIGLDKNDLL